MSQYGLFNGVNAAGHYGVWLTDGTVSGTHELITSSSNSNNFYPYEFSKLNGLAVFGAVDSGGTYSLWTTNGLSSGTQELIVATNTSPSYGLYPYAFVNYNGHSLFAGLDTANNYQLWTTDGTVAGTQQLVVAGASSGGLSPQELVAYNGNVLFNGRDSSSHENLWMTDGTSAGTTELAAVSGASATGLSPYGLTAVNGKVLFSGRDSAGHQNLWTTDGTAVGTTELTVAGESASGLNPNDLVAFGNLLAFRGTDVNGHDNLWITDGTAAGTSEITAAGASSSGLSPHRFLVYHGALYFGGQDAAGQDGFWVTDGTSAGTHEIVISGTGSSGIAISSQAVAGDRMIFAGTDSNSNRSLWSSDGTTAGTFKLNVSGTAANFNPVDLTSVTFTPSFTAQTATASASGSLGVGATVSFVLGVNTPVTVDTSGGTPTLTLDDGAAATYAGLDGSGNLLFTYTVANGDNTPDLQVTGLSLNGAVIGYPLNAIDTSGVATLAGSNTGFAVTTPGVPPPSPTFTSDIATASMPGPLSVGATVSFVLGVSTPVTVDTSGGTPTLTLDDGAAATYAGLDGSGDLLFTYTVANGDNTPDLQVTGLSLNGAVIGHQLNALDPSGLATLAGSNTGFAVATPGVPPPSPTFTSNIATASMPGPVGVGATVSFVLGVSTPLTVDTSVGTPTLTLDDGAAATYAGLDGSGNLLFTYTVANGDNTPDLQVTGLSLNGAVIGHQLNALDSSGLATLAGSNTGFAVATPGVPPPLPAAPIVDATVSVYRFFDRVNGTHLYTTSTAERDQVLSSRPDLTYEGQPFNAVSAASKDPTVSPIYRFFDTNNGDHFFTASATEASMIQATRGDMRSEGIGFGEYNQAITGAVAVYRFFDSSNGDHVFTSSAAEMASIKVARPGMISEGVAFYAPQNASL